MDSLSADTQLRIYKQGLRNLAQRAKAIAKAWCETCADGNRVLHQFCLCHGLEVPGGAANARAAQAATPTATDQERGSIFNAALKLQTALRKSKSKDIWAAENMHLVRQYIDFDARALNVDAVWWPRKLADDPCLQTLFLNLKKIGLHGGPSAAGAAFRVLEARAHPARVVVRARSQPPQG